MHRAQLHLWNAIDAAGIAAFGFCLAIWLLAICVRTAVRMVARGH